MAIRKKTSDAEGVCAPPENRRELDFQRNELEAVKAPRKSSECPESEAIERQRVKSCFGIDPTVWLRVA